MLFLLSFKVFWRELKSGQLSVMFIALLLAVTSVSCISIFTDRLQKALLLETQEFLGGDLKYESNEKLLPSVLKEINYDIFVKSEVTSFASMISAADNMQLSSVKAVDSFYPLIGHVELEDESSQGKQYLESPPPRNHVWIDKRLKELLEVEIGDFIEIGNANFIVSHTLISEPDRGSSSFAFAPKAIINVEDLPETNILQPGSRVRYTYLFLGEKEEILTLKDNLENAKKAGDQITVVGNNQASIGSAVKRSQNFFLLGGLLAVLLAAFTVGITSQRFVRRHVNYVAILRSLGASSFEVKTLYTLIFTQLAIASIVLGITLGWFIQNFFVSLLKDYFPTNLPDPGIEPLIISTFTVVICLGGFCLPYIVKLLNVSPIIILRKEGNVVGEIPVTIALDPPQYRMFGKRGTKARTQAQINPAAFPDLIPEQAGDILLQLLKRPNLASKHKIYRQYDHQVLTNTVVGPGGDAAVLRIPETQQGIAITTDCNGHYCELDPYTGGAIAVAEAARNIVCTGAKPVAVTDCLNFGSPDNEEVAFALEESIRGIADACNTFGTPVVSGNVSLYNETGGNPIAPTPVVGMLGVLDDVEKHLKAGFNKVDADVWLIGQKLEQNASTLSGSEYLASQYGNAPGTPQIDLDHELKLQKFILSAHQQELLLNAHDCSEGGLTVALTECCIIGKYGFYGTFPKIKRFDATLFGEGQSRVIVSTRPKHRKKLEQSAFEQNMPLTYLGTTKAKEDGFHFGPITLPVDMLEDAWKSIDW